MDLRARFLEIAQGDESAAQFLVAVNFIVRIWDDLIDKDKPIADADVNKAFWLALVELPRNEFYLRNFQALNPVIALLIQNWMCSNELRKGSEQDKRIAFVIRCCESDLNTQVALICGGYEWAQKIAPILRRAWHHQSFSDYLSDLEKANHEPRQPVPAACS